MRKYMLFLVLSAALVVGSSDLASAEPGSSTPTQRVAPEELGVDPSTATTDWRAEDLGGGVVKISFGDLSRTRPDAGAKRVASGRPAEGSVTTAALSWYCDVYTTFATTLSSPYLQTAYQVNCYNVNRHRVDWQFQRSSWSGYRSYTNWTTGGWVSSTLNAQTIYAFCGSGGTYDYRGNVKSVVDVGGSIYTSPSQATATGRYACGTGVS